MLIIMEKGFHTIIDVAASAVKRLCYSPVGSSSGQKSTATGNRKSRLTAQCQYLQPTVGTHPYPCAMWCKLCSLTWVPSEGFKIAGRYEARLESQMVLLEDQPALPRPIEKGPFSKRRLALYLGEADLQLFDKALSGNREYFVRVPVNQLSVAAPTLNHEGWYATSYYMNARSAVGVVILESICSYHSRAHD